MLLEREKQLADLAAIVVGLEKSGGRVVLIRGEAGIGKTSLVDELVDRHRDTAHILIGACDDLLTPQTLGPFWDVARDEPDVEVALETDDRRRVQEAVLTLLSRRLRPTILIIEDTQWADESTLDAIRYLGRRVARTNGVILLTYRDSEVDLDHPLRQVIGDLPATAVVRMPLEPLSAKAIAAMIGEGHHDVAAVLHQTDGNPLYVTEMLAWDSDDVPSSIHEMVVARASKASPGAEQLLAVVSVVPGEAERDLVASLVGEKLDGLEEAQQLGLLRATTDTIHYVHELQRRAIESSLLPDRRRNLNASILATLGPGTDPARLVHHSREAGDVDALIIYAPIAARAAIAAGSSTEAVEHFRLIEPYLDRLDIGVAAAVLYEWAEQAHHQHDAAAVDLIQRSVDLRRADDDEVALGDALTLASRINLRHLNTAMAMDLATEAVDVLAGHPDTPEHATALSELAFVTWLHLENVPAGIDIADRALEAADRSGDADARIEALIAKGNMQWSIGIKGGMDLLETARALAHDVGNRQTETRALSNMTSMAADFRNMPLATDLVRRTLETAARYEMPAIEARTQAMYAEILLWNGDWDKVDDAATAALGATPYTETIAWRVLGTLQARRGRSETRTALDRMWALAQSAEQLTVLDPAASALAEFMWLSGERDSGWLKPLDAVLAQGLKAGTPWPSGALAFWMWKLGRLDARPEGTFEFYGWIIDEEPERSVEFWRSRAVPYETALALMHCGTDGELEALRISEDLGADALASRIRKHLAERGVAAPRGKGRATREHAAGLTRRQAEVLDLLAEELTNAEIADRLFLSPRTVENHVAAILMKLDVPSREAAVAVSTERQLI